jgi:proteic killer suppression protein
MIQSFKDAGTEDIFDGAKSRAALKCCPKAIWPVARRKLDQLNRVRELAELKVPPGNRLELLKGDREGQCSIRINQQYRIYRLPLTRPSDDGCPSIARRLIQARCLQKNFSSRLP